MEKEFCMVYMQTQSLVAFLRDHQYQQPQPSTPPDQNEDWAFHLERKIGSLISTSLQEELWKRRSIYCVPPYMKDLNSSAYLPKMVSIGPYHHGEPNLVPMEEHKHRALQGMLARSGKPIKEFVGVLEPVVEELMGAYERLDTRFEDTGKFLEIMIVDGCFLLEILRAFGAKGETSYAANDPIFSLKGLDGAFTYLVRDLLMVENQLPLMVLVKLLSVGNGKPSNENEEFIKKVVLEATTLDRPLPNVGKCLHVLDIFRKGKTHGPPQKCSADPQGQYKRAVSSASEVPIVRSATDLHEACVKFRRSETYSLTDITFNNNILTLPVFTIRDMNETVFLNLIAFEQLHPNTRCELRSYFFFMACLLKSEKDVRFLQHHKLIQSTVSSDEAVIFGLIKKLPQDIMTMEPDSRLHEIQHQLDDYYQKNMKRWIKRLRHWRLHLIRTHFKNPWTFISLLGVILFIGLTLIQTFYAVIIYQLSENNIINHK